MKNYEIMFIVRSDIEEKLVKQTASNFEDLLKSYNLKVTVRDLGQKRLAYDIKKQKSGYYFLFNVEATAEAIKEFDRKASLDESVIRHLIIKMDEE
jgi:small subunit ribosomal protein S6